MNVASLLCGTFIEDSGGRVGEGRRREKSCRGECEYVLVMVEWEVSKKCYVLARGEVNGGKLWGKGRIRGNWVCKLCIRKQVRIVTVATYVRTYTRTYIQVWTWNSLECIHLSINLPWWILSVLCHSSGPCASGTSGCEHNCFTIANSYRCGCNAGFTLNADRHKCDGKFCPMNTLPC